MHETVPAEQSTRLLDTRGAEWLGVVARRMSRRAFDGQPVDAERLDALEATCDALRPYDDARVVLVRKPATDVFSGVLGMYGKVTGAPHVLVFVGDARAPFADQHVGYAGEAAILEATALGLDTCWVGGFFSESRVGKVVELAAGERVLAVSPLGTARAAQTVSERAMRGMASAKKRKCVAELAPGIDSEWPDWAVAAVETARFAPSAMNRQPWRFRLDDAGLVIARDSAVETPKVTKRLDCGIAMLHAHLGAAAEGAPGRWTDLDAGLDVARYVPESAE